MLGSFTAFPRHKIWGSFAYLGLEINGVRPDGLQESRSETSFLKLSRARNMSPSGLLEGGCGSLAKSLSVCCKTLYSSSWISGNLHIYIREYLT